MAARLEGPTFPNPVSSTPWPQQRFAVKHPRWEPGAGKRSRFVAGRLRPKQIVVAAMRKLLVICRVLKTGKPFDAATAMPA